MKSFHALIHFASLFDSPYPPGEYHDIRQEMLSLPLNKKTIPNVNFLALSERYCLATQVCHFAGTLAWHAKIEQSEAITAQTD